ncbi:tail fiber protein [Pectobacterium actinidiae]|uniref:phage tail protein n=1 Tax=Pectobacterium actinidiae TaxID=1507808 RepID=UPI0023AB4CD0|nr:tail fiber protein [Pectobacterium actinidiae]WEF13664.1 tail fiber protein [Pectobacterium actinidiae]
MANLSENPQWVDGIYQIETSDPVVGGPDGVSNRQAKELASRTRYLKKEQEKTGSDLATHAAAADPHTQYAPKANPTFTGTPKAPTPATDSNSQQVATTAFVKSVAAALVNGAPAALDTLQELAKAMGNDPNFSATVLGELAKKLSLSGGTLTGELLLSAANALRLIYGDYGVIIRNDGNRFYLLLTNKGDKTGSYNSLRPLDINLATGDITVGHNLNVTGLLNEKGQRVYSPNNKPTAADVGAITKSDADNNYVRQGLSGVIYQKDELPWNSPTGVYLKDNVTHSSLIWHMGANTGSASAAQFYFDFANGGIKYRSSRDNFGFEKTWARIYSDQDKPTAADIGAIPFSGGTLTGELTSAKPDNYRISYGDYGVYMRNDGISFYTLITNKGDPGGQYNSLRPFRIYLDSGDVQMAQNVDVGGFLSEKGQRVYSPNNKPTADDIGSFPMAELVGIPLPYPGATAPVGWLKCNGQAFDKAKYPVLGSCYPAGKLPDLRGEFIRGWDDGRGVDSGRALLSLQGDAIRNIRGTIGQLNDRVNTTETSGVFDANRYSGSSSGLAGGNGGRIVTFDASKVVPIANENRPRNIAFNYIVRAA